MTRLKRLLPRRLKDAVILWRVFSDRASRKAFRDRHERPGEPVALRIRELDGRALWMRPQTADGYVIREAFWSRDSLPPDGFQPKSILDVGANVGATMAFLSARFPEASIAGVEPHPANAEMCRRNTNHPVIEAAAWTENGTVTLSGEQDTAKLGEGGVEVPAVPLAELMPVDYLKLDVEGAERELLTRNTGWAGRVRCINVEVHEPYTAAECTRDLQALGYTVTLRPGPRQPRVIGTRV
jgi:FkbM family methyltransferase